MKKAAGAVGVIGIVLAVIGLILMISGMITSKNCPTQNLDDSCITTSTKLKMAGFILFALGGVSLIISPIMLYAAYPR